MKSVNVHCDFFKQIRKHTDEEIGRFFRALASEIDGEECPELPPTLAMLKEMVSDQNNRFSEQQRNKRIKPNEPKAPNKPNEPKQPTVSITVTDSVPVPVTNTKDEGFTGDESICGAAAPKKQKFTQPSVSDVAAYCRERGNSVDAQAFVDFYTSKGWVVGKSPMKDWRSAVRTWERNHFANGNSSHGGQARAAPDTPSGGYERTKAALERVRGDVAGVTE